MMMMGKLKSKKDKQSSITLILAVLNNFIRKRFTAKSRERMSDCVKQQAADPYIRIGKHLVATS